ncbi:MAG: dCTP deaminase [Candidatus Taylorbacteria bacterium]|nr:dCTP deaminase [Candidatus Taylorbacteria bacterium]
MAILTRDNILKRVKAGELGFSPPLDSFELQDHAVDLRLGFTFLIPKRWHQTERGREALDISHFDKENQRHFDVVELEEKQYFDLLPSEYIIVSTLESLKVPNDLMGVLYPRSSTNRKGLSLDLTGIIDSGYKGQLTLPIRNNTHSQTVRLFPGERICQVVFETLDQKINPRKSKYHERDIADGISREKKKEVNLIIKGEIRKLKSDYAVI